MDLDRSAQKLWAEYLEAEQDRIRDVMTSALDRFIHRLLEHPVEVWHAWAKTIASDVSDGGSDTPVRFPLFRRVLLPALADGVRRGEPGCARWLASFESLLFHSRESGLPKQLQTAVGLLNEAVRLDPEDVRARRNLVERHASYLEYTLHELPAGVLYGRDGATAEQCEELLALLEDFKQHVSRTSQSERFEELTRDCEFHYRTYATYRRSDPLPGGYEEYLARQRTG